MVRKHTEISLVDKMNIINQVANGEDKLHLAKEHNTNASTITLIYKNRHLILNSITNWHLKRLRRSKYYRLNKAIIIYFRQAVAYNKILNSRIIKEKATFLAEKLSIKDFTASGSWMQKFNKKYCINMQTLWCFKNNLPASVKGEFLSDNEIVERVMSEERSESSKNGSMNSAEDDKSEENEEQDEADNNSLEEKEEDEHDQTCDSLNEYNEWKQDIKPIVNDSTGENENGRTVYALKTISNTLDRLDIVPNDVLKAFTLVEVFIKKEISGDNV